VYNSSGGKTERGGGGCSKLTKGEMGTMAPSKCASIGYFDDSPEGGSLSRLQTLAGHGDL